MCKTIAESQGDSRRRCPIHQSVSVIATKQIADQYGLSVTSAKSLFLAVREAIPEPVAGYQESEAFAAYKNNILEQVDAMPQRYKRLANDVLKHEIDDRTAQALVEYEQHVQDQVFAESRLLHNVSLNSGFSHQALLQPELIDPAYEASNVFAREDYNLLRDQANALEEQYGYISSHARIKTITMLAVIMDNLSDELVPSHTSDDGTVIYSEELGIVEVTGKNYPISYKNVSHALAQQLLNPRTRAKALKTTRHNPIHQWENEGARSLGVRGFGAQRCQTCGRFMGDGHQCDLNPVNLDDLSDYDKWVIQQARYKKISMAERTSDPDSHVLPFDSRVITLNNSHIAVLNKAVVQDSDIALLPPIQSRALDEEVSIQGIREALDGLNIPYPVPMKQVRTTKGEEVATFTSASPELTGSTLELSDQAENMHDMITESNGYFTLDLSGSLQGIRNDVVHASDGEEFFPEGVPVNANLTGNLLMQVDEHGHYSVLSSKQLQCDCDEYQEKYYCPHVRLAETLANGYAELVLHQDTSPTTITDPQLAEKIDHILSTYGTPTCGEVKEYGTHGTAASKLVSPEYRLFMDSYEATDSESAKHLESHDIIDNTITTQFIDSFDTVQEFLDFRERYDGYSYSTLNTEFYADTFDLEQGHDGVSSLPVTTWHRVMESTYQISNDDKELFYVTTHWVDEEGEYQYVLEDVVCLCGVRHREIGSNTSCPHWVDATRFAALAAGHVQNQALGLEQESNQELFTFIQDKLLTDRIASGITGEGSVDEANAIQILQEMKERSAPNAIAKEQINEVIMRNAALNPTLKDFRSLLEENYEKSLDDYMLDFIPEMRPGFYSEVESFRAERVSAWEAEYEPGFNGDEERITRVIKSAQSRRKRLGKERLLEPLRDNVTNGICDPEVPGSLRFGVELEFDFPAKWSEQEVEQAQQAIAQELHASELTRRNTIGDYHSSGDWDKWNYEKDQTVRGGEIVSPIMSDTPEAWEELGKTLEIIKKHGGITSVNAGSHVNISSSVFASNVASNVELLRLGEEHKEALFAVATSPYASAHRGRKYCEPNLSTPRGDISKYDPDFRYLEGGSQQLDLEDDFSSNVTTHGAMINLENSFTHDEKSRVEFRQWDSSLDLATIQTQVAISAAMIDKAQHTVTTKGYSPARVEGSLESTEDLSLSAAALADKIFLRQSDRERMLALFT